MTKSSVLLEHNEVKGRKFKMQYERESKENQRMQLNKQNEEN